MIPAKGGQQKYVTHIKFFLLLLKRGGGLTQPKSFESLFCLPWSNQNQRNANVVKTVKRAKENITTQESWLLTILNLSKNKKLIYVVKFLVETYDKRQSSVLLKVSRVYWVSKYVALWQCHLSKFLTFGDELQRSKVWKTFQHLNFNHTSTPKRFIQCKILQCFLQPAKLVMFTDWLTDS